MFSLVPYRPYLPRKMGRGPSLLADSFFRDFFAGEDFVQGNSFRVDIRDKGNSYLLEAELPGVERDKLSIQVDKDVLTISAELAHERKEERDGYSYYERRSGHTERSFNLEGIDQDKIQAEYKDGILAVTLPKLEPQPEKTAKKIPINLGSPEAKLVEPEKSAN